MENVILDISHLTKTMETFAKHVRRSVKTVHQKTHAWFVNLDIMLATVVNA